MFKEVAQEGDDALHPLGGVVDLGVRVEGRSFVLGHFVQVFKQRVPVLDGAVRGLVHPAQLDEIDLPDFVRA